MIHKAINMTKYDQPNQDLKEIFATKSASFAPHTYYNLENKLEELRRSSEYKNANEKGGGIYRYVDVLTRS